MIIKSEYLYMVKCEIKSFFLKKKVLKYLESVKSEETDIVCRYIRKKNKLPIIPYDYVAEYNKLNIDIRRDNDNGLFYILEDGKKLYLQKRFFLKAHARRYYKNICIEQDFRSPHAYTSDNFDVDDGCVLMDIGAAEGIFVLRNIDRISEAYIFECDDRWIEALEYTFADYRDKVHIIKKYVGDKNEGEYIRLDDFKEISDIEHKKLFVKMDIEGAETTALSNAGGFLSSSAQTKLAVCTYHRSAHEKTIRSMFANHKISTSEGYMFFYYDKQFDSPYIRRGVLRIDLKNK